MHIRPHKSMGVDSTGVIEENREDLNRAGGGGGGGKEEKVSLSIIYLKLLDFEIVKINWQRKKKKKRVLIRLQGKLYV